MQWNRQWITSRDKRHSPERPIQKAEADRQGTTRFLQDLQRHRFARVIACTLPGHALFRDEINALALRIRMDRAEGIEPTTLALLTERERHIPFQDGSIVLDARHQSERSSREPDIVRRLSSSRHAVACTSWPRVASSNA